MNDAATIATVVAEYVRNNYLQDYDGEFGDDTPLISGGIVDSFSMVALKMFVERKYHVAIPNEIATPETFDTVRSIATLVHAAVEEDGHSAR